MSTEREPILNTGRKGVNLEVLQFSGGKEKGRMLQLTQGHGFGINEPGFIQLTEKNAMDLTVELIKWLNHVE